MPFELAGEGGGSEELARISEQLVADLSGRRGGRLEVIGPRSTAAYSAFPFPDLERLADELAPDFVLNARFLEHEGDDRLLVELIRLDDGAHPWAEIFPGTRSPEAIARAVRDGVVAALGLPAADEPNDEESGGVRP
jgi:TolB-like protein